MSSPYTPLTPAAVHFDANGKLYSPTYGDVYHSPSGALGQSEHVFLRGNDLPQRWQGRPTFTVCETGFGLGLNFLALWQAWRNDPNRSARLHVVAIEGHPFSRADVTQLLTRYAPESVQGLADQLAAQWPDLLPGLHRLEFEEGAVTLTLGFGTAQWLAPRLVARVDAYFLDGFAPAANPEMWSTTLLRDLARLAAPGATMATWACTGELRQALQLAGFQVRRAPGYGGKWHMTVGHMGETEPRTVAATAVERHAIVIGGGLAGGGVAQALALRGWRVTVLDAGNNTHTTHAAAALTPVIARDDNSRARLSRVGSQRAHARWSSLANGAAPLVCGTVQVERDAGRAAAMADTLAALAFPSDWVRAISRDEASALAGLPIARGGVFFSQGMLVQPGRLIEGLMATPGVTRLTCRAERLTRTADQWQVMDPEGLVLAQASTVVVANASDARRLLAESGLLEPLPRLSQMHALAGEVTFVPAQTLDGGPKCIVGGEGYLLPAIDGTCVVGSTYVHDAATAAVSAEGQSVTLAKAGGLLAAAPNAFKAIEAGSLAGWAGWRAVLPGRMPAVGQLAHAPGVWLAVGYASRGLSWSALMGDLIAASLCGEPLPLESDLIASIGPR